MLDARRSFNLRPMSSAFFKSSSAALAASALLLGLAPACAKGVTDNETSRTGPLSVETHRNPHGGNGLGAGGRMTDDWIYPEPQPGEGHHAGGSHGDEEKVSSPHDVPPAEQGHGPKSH